MLQALKTVGVQIAIDDFGTGCSSLSYLRDFPIDALKVDKSFVQEITSGSTPAPIVSAVISMGKSLKHRVIAEGVETREQLAFLQAEDCDEGQGYLFSRPVVARAVRRHAGKQAGPVARCALPNGALDGDVEEQTDGQRNDKPRKGSWRCSTPATTRSTWCRSF